MQFFVTLRYRGQTVVVPHHETEAADVTAHELANFYWLDGNGSCDCNRSLAGREHGADWPELPCGSDQVDLVSIVDEDGIRMVL